MNITEKKLIWREFTDRAQRAAEASDHGKCEELLLQAYEYALQLFGADSGEVGLILLKLGNVCEDQGKPELAVAYWAEADRIARFYEETSE